MIFNMWWCVSIIMTSLHVPFNPLLMEICYHVQLDRLVKEFIVPLEKQISSEQEEKQVVEKETQEIVGQKRLARTSMSSSASKAEQMVAAGGKRRSKRVKVAPTRYFPVVEEESWTTSPRASSGVVTMHTALTDSPPLENSLLATDETTMNGSNEDTNIGSSRRESAEAAVRVPKARKGQQTFDERFKDLMAFKAEFGHCDVSLSKSSDKKHSSLGRWCHGIRKAYEIMKKEGKPRRYKLSKSDIKHLENAGFEWVLRKTGTLTFDERFKDLMTFKKRLGTSMCLYQNQETISIFLWEDGAMMIERHMKSRKREGYRNTMSFPKVTLSALFPEDRYSYF